MPQPRNRRILHCIPSLMIGGAERQVVLLSSALREAGWEIHIASIYGGSFEPLVGDSATLHRIAFRSHYDPMIAVRIARLIRRLRPALVQTWMRQMDVFGGAAALATGVPWIISEQASALCYPPDWRYTLRNLIGRLANGVVANSYAGASWWRGRNYRHENHRVIPNLLSIPPADLAVPRARPARRPRILYVGRLAGQKRVDKLIDALAVLRQLIEFECTICGDGPLAEELHARAERLGLSDVVRFPGFVMDVPQRLRDADVFVSVSAFEGMPNAVEEAMAAGTPVVISDIPEHREMSDERCAVLVDGADPRAIARGIVATLGDPLRAARRAAAARERVIASSSHVVAAWSEFYERLIA